MTLMNFGGSVFRGIAKTIKQNTSFITQYALHFSNRTVVVQSSNGVKHLFLNFTCRSFSSAIDVDISCKYGRQEKTRLSNVTNYPSSDLDIYWKREENAETVPSQFSEYDIGERLGRPSCKGAVYVAEYNGNEVALKIMFNYDVPSDETDIPQAFEREYKVLPSAEIMSDQFTTVDNNVLDRNSNENIILKEHPNIIKLLGIFTDDTPLLYDSIKSYPLALPKHIFPDGCGRDQTTCLVMPKYTCSLREYLHQNQNTLTNVQRLSILCQLLEGVAHLERYKVSHRDLKSDNLLIDCKGDGNQRLAITDFGSCLTEETMLSLFNTIDADRGGNLLLRSPEIINAVPQQGLYLDYSKADAWTCGSIAYEIFTQENPFFMKYNDTFYTRLQNSSYQDEVLLEMPLNSGNYLIDKIVHALLRNNPQERITACEAATLMALIFNAPRKWLKFPHTVTEMEIDGWLCDLSINTRRECGLYEDGIYLPPDILLKLVFLSRVSSSEILNVLVIAGKLQDN